MTIGTQAADPPDTFTGVRSFGEVVGSAGPLEPACAVETVPFGVTLLLLLSWRAIVTLASWVPGHRSRRSIADLWLGENSIRPGRSQE